MNNRINHIHERVLRLVYNNYTNSFKELLLLDNAVCVHHRNIQKVAVEMFKFKHRLCPNLISDLFEIKNDERSKRVFHRPKVNSVYKGTDSLRSFCPIVWDTMIPEELKCIENLEVFKREVKNWTPENCHCRLCLDYIQNVGHKNMSL